LTATKTAAGSTGSSAWSSATASASSAKSATTTAAAACRRCALREDTTFFEYTVVIRITQHGDRVRCR
jgi:hypothetical protein